MSRHAFFIAIEHDRWHAASVAGSEVTWREIAFDRVDKSDDAVDAPADSEAGPSSHAGPSPAAIRKAMRELGYGGQGICLALPSQRVLVGRIDATNLPRRDRHPAMLFRLEDQLPLPAEALTADFLPAGGHALGAAVETGDVQAIITRLAEAGVEVASLCPTALLAAWRHAERAGEGRRYLVLAGDTTNDILCLSSGRPVAWYAMPRGVEALRQTLRADLLATLEDETAAARALVLGDLDGEELSCLRDELPGGVEAVEATDVRTEAALAAAERLAGRPAGWIDLRRDGLALGGTLEKLGWPLRIAALLTIAALATVAVLCTLRAGEYEAVAARYDAEQATVYRELYPSGRVPVGVRSRLESELTRLAATRGEGGELPRQIDALDALMAAVSALPEAMRLRVTEMHLTPITVRLEGQTRSHGDAEAIVRSLKSTGFAIDPPSTEHLVAGGVSFTMTGRPPVPDAGAGEEHGQEGASP